MPVLVDGNNLLHRLPPESRSREQVRRLSLELARHEHMHITVVFDGPPPSGSPLQEDLGNVTVVYSDSQSADDAVVARLPQGTAAKNWVVVTGDRELARRSKQRGATVRPLGEWQAKLKRVPQPDSKHEPALSEAEVEEWEVYFSQRPVEE